MTAIKAEHFKQQKHTVSAQNQKPQNKMSAETHSICLSLGAVLPWTTLQSLHIDSSLREDPGTVT